MADLGIEVKEELNRPPDEPKRFEIKVPYIVKDEYGNEATLYKREFLSQESLDNHKAFLLEKIQEVDEKISSVQEINKENK